MYFYLLERSKSFPLHTCEVEQDRYYLTFSAKKTVKWCILLHTLREGLHLDPMPLESHIGAPWSNIIKHFKVVTTEHWSNHSAFLSAWSRGAAHVTHPWCWSCCVAQFCTLGSTTSKSWMQCMLQPSCRMLVPSGVGSKSRGKKEAEIRPWPDQTTWGWEYSFGWMGTQILRVSLRHPGSVAWESTKDVANR